MTILTFRGKTPRIADDAFVAPGARLIGDVELGAGASIWYNCVVRGDVNPIRIGARTNIQDGSIIHVESPRYSSPKGEPTTIGADVLIGHMAIVHGCVLHDRAFVGMGAIVMNGCEIESDGLLAAGAVLSPGRRIGARQLWVGRPAKYVRDLSDEEIADMQFGVSLYADLAQAHRESCEEQGMGLSR